MTAPAWLVTGGSGFLGRPLLDLLRRDRPGDRVVALGRTLPAGWPADAFRAGDLEDPAGLAAIVAEVRPNRVVHLAGRTPPAPADRLYRSNVLATLHLLDALRASTHPVRVVLVGSAAELGPVPAEHLPVAEDYPCRPATPYGLGKLLATTAGLAAGPPLDVVVARVFNPIGPGMPASQAFGRFAAELAGNGGPITLRLGDLDARRDFVDARDVARALVALADAGRPGHAYHIGTGRSRRVGEGLAALIALSGRAVAVESATGPGPGPPDSRADVAKIAADTGWGPAIPWRDSLRDLWDEAAGRARRRD